MEAMLAEYLPIFIFIGIAVAMASAILIASFVSAGRARSLRSRRSRGGFIHGSDARRVPSDLHLYRYRVARQRPDPAKVSAYECGFDAFGDARGRFDVRFYLVAILFIIFDLEIAFLFPWAIALGDIGVFGYWSMMVFLGVLTIGFVYEWKKGALEWE